MRKGKTNISRVHTSVYSYQVIFSQPLNIRVRIRKSRRWGGTEHDFLYPVVVTTIQNIYSSIVVYLLVSLKRMIRTLIFTNTKQTSMHYYCNSKGIIWKRFLVIVLPTSAAMWNTQSRSLQRSETCFAFARSPCTYSTHADDNASAGFGAGDCMMSKCRENYRYNFIPISKEITLDAPLSTDICKMCNDTKCLNNHRGCKFVRE